MKREILITSDGSSTIHLPDWNEQYHSKNGSINETYHVFIESGLKQLAKNKVAILEIGFGTGLNCFITYLEAQKEIDYVGVEAYPVTPEEVEKMNFIDVLNAGDKKDVFDKMHATTWEEKHKISSNFSLTKRKQFFEDIEDINNFDLIYFDAFGARVQPQLWTEDIFAKMFTSLKENGILVTYSAKGSVRRAMQAVGFLVERLPGPPGKREMLRAIKKAT
ncbi:tRNA (5-methylaminomethyl-2-thiouridine)(34)-methyltransferase MnmD [Polaribacter tangerinus]|uniref:tRNA (5-methylaminomethyl-2-thiouridine)(34)-methyltransferase MnmD n=1 Tax=Polaribacter tangerinus TaxID=1920034 RepID=UPI000B4A9FDF|nr:tRNA (5-methylaminomethyl-2-thiouridine)(34)-methyltransferase MnmD [Polaribacter tangerinus]